MDKISSYEKVDVRSDALDSIDDKKNANKSILQEHMEAFIHFTLRKAIENFILVALAIAVVLAFSIPSPGQTTSDLSTRDLKSIVAFVNTVIVFFVSGLTLKIEDIKDLTKYRNVILFGLASINFFTTLMAFIMQRLPFSTHEYSVGLTIFQWYPQRLE